MSATPEVRHIGPNISSSSLDYKEHRKTRNCRGEMGCREVIVTNACGHNMRLCYAYCGGNHLNNPNTNRVCYEITKPIISFKSIRRYAAGRDFCSPGCRAWHLGWLCCTCNYRLVRGYIDDQTRLLVHKTPTGMIHALCTGCLILV